MRFILILSNILLNTLLALAYQSNYIQVIGSLSSLKNSFIVDGGVSIYSFDISLKIEYNDYGEVKNYGLLNSEYYIETGSYRIYETLLSASIGINLGNFRSFTILKSSVISAITQSVGFYYGVGGSLSFAEGLVLGFNVDDFEPFSGNVRFLGYVSYSDTNLIDRIYLSISKSVISTLGFEVLSEVRLLKLEYFSVNVGLGYNGSFGGRQLYPYLTTLKLILPYGFEIFNTTRFSEFAYDTSIGITYEFDSIQ
ncbi:MAG: hypothetical protein RMJ37_02470 [Spirochaetia bacterium]|nr:hypothetical protein [Spirochaetota bacterium]MCX8097070.1 hypothetical protein [Spirochaetota bacterium]MDW8112191.1 hypothetical protein [Spirochaetia bacterium]